MVRRFHGEEAIMKCMYCQGEMHKGTAPVHIDRHGIHVSLDEVPAWVCSQCGEAYFEESQVDSIQGIVRTVDRQAQELAKTG